MEVKTTPLYILFTTFFLLLVFAITTKPSFGNSLNEDDSVIGPLVCEVAYLPIILNDPFASPCDTNNNYCEENDLYTSAYGPLESGIPYSAYMEDSNDFYYIKVPELGEITINVTNFQPKSGQLQLRDSNLKLLEKDFYRPGDEMQVSHTRTVDEDEWYLIWLSSDPGDTSNEIYTLVANYPTPPVNHQPPPPPLYRILEEFTPDSDDPNLPAPYLHTTWWTTIEDEDVFTFSVLPGTEAMPARSGPHMAQVDYEKTDTYQFLGAELPVESRDLSWAEVIDVWVKGDVTLLMKVEEDVTKDEDELETLVSISADEWSLLRYDITDLTTVDPSKIKSLKFFPAPGDASASGTFYIDSIVTRANGNMLEPFEPNISTLDWWTPDPLSFSYSRNIKGCNTSYALQVDVTKTEEFQFIGAELPPGLRDISHGKTLEFLVYGAVDIEVKLEEDNGENPGQEVTLGRLVSATPRGWSQLRFDYSHVEDTIDLTKVRNILFFPYPGDASANGTISLDSIQISNDP